ncbi:MAG: hypothetical protein HZA93_13165 [Verrucomicrobia bacterium]|nr:hypothetical protein [Verrucomicrobiota bacterium]
MNTATATTEIIHPSVAQAFDDLAQARTLERDTREAADDQRRALRRFAYRHKLTCKQARSWLRIHQEADYLALIRAELAHDRALRAFRRVAMIAALTKVIDTDNRLRAERTGVLVIDDIQTPAIAC